MRRTVSYALRAAWIILCAAFLVAAFSLGAWYVSQALQGNDARAELESRWRESRPYGDAVSVSPGDVVGRIIVPRMGLDVPLVEMADVDDRENLNKGPAHLAGSALPGQPGNCVIAGHRTTYSRPFFSLDTMEEGDEIVLVDLSRNTYSYQVTQVLIVEPDDVWVMEPTSEPSTTLIACHPLFSARKRIVVKAVVRR